MEARPILWTGPASWGLYSRALAESGAYTLILPQPTLRQAEEVASRANCSLRELQAEVSSSSANASTSHEAADARAQADELSASAEQIAHEEREATRLCTEVGAHLADVQLEESEAVALRAQIEALGQDFFCGGLCYLF